MSQSRTRRKLHPPKMFCWGSTTNGELGLGGIEEELILAPRELKFKEAFEVVQIASGEFHTIALTTNGKAYSCGSNDHSQLGHSKSCKRFELIDGLETYFITRAACGIDFSMVLDEWGRVLCWGSDSHGQLGLGMGGALSPPQITPKLVKGLATTTLKVVQIACGQRHCLVLTNNGELYGWGCNSYGQLGIGTTTAFEASPCLVGSLTGLPIASVECGANHSFVVSKSGAVYGWGKNTFGQLGLNDDVNKVFPNQLRSLRFTKVKYISCGEDFSVFLTKDGGVFTCGAGMYGQLGHGAITNEYLPRKIMELMGSTVTQVSCGRRHTLAFVPSRGRVYAFGLGGAGQLGTRATLNANTPQVVLGSWVSPSGVPVVDVGAQAGAEKQTASFTIKRIYAGGDHCFAAVTYYLDMIAPDDLREQPRNTQILSLTYDKMKECEGVGATESVNMDLLEYVETIFNSQACINSSFLLPHDEHYCCSSKNHGVNLSMAEKSFACIGRVENESIKTLIGSLLAATLTKLSPSPPDIETLRVYLLYPLYYEFENPKNWEKLQNRYGFNFLRLKAEAAKVIGIWWGLMPNDYFERLVRIFKSVVLYLLTQAAQATPEMDGCSPNMIVPLELLGRLNKLNNTVDEQKVPYDSFYISELSEKLDVRLDYMKWVINRDPQLTNKVYFCNYPFLFDASAKTMLLQTDQSMQMQSAVNMAATRALTSLIFSPVLTATISPHLELTVSRENIVSDTIRELVSLDSSELKKPLKVRFMDEEAEDAGGVRKEFFMLLLREILDPKYGMFRQYEETRTVWFSEDSLEETIMYYLIGILCGLAIYNFTIINLPFPLALYKKLLKERITLQDLKGLSPTMAKSLQDVLDYKEPDLQDVFGLTFEITREAFGEVKTIPLKPGGGDIPVTQENKVEFVDLYVDLLLNTAVEKQYVAFAEGFNRVCGSKVMELFHSHELMAVVVGNENYDWEQLEANAEYRNGYTASDATIKLFWEVFHELTEEERKMFLLFLTGCDRIPIMGMKAIKIYIQPTTDDKFLPVAHTCFNLLDLPRYSTKEKLRYKLQQAIQQTQGFSLV